MTTQLAPGQRIKSRPQRGLVLPDQETPIGPTVLPEDSRRRTSAYPPVFLHCGWRTRGTWVWNRFREMQGVTGFYEPLAEPLATLRPGTLASMNAEAWPSGHRDLDRPYFDEFRPLLRTGRAGVRGYQTHFATDNFFAAPDTEMHELYQYLDGLLQVAREQGEQPVLKFCRSIGRLGWMRRRFPDAVHIVVSRDPFSQFESALRQFVRDGNAYFISMPLLLLAINRDLPAVNLCLRHLGADVPNLTGCRTMRALLAACEAHLRHGNPAAWYRGFLAFWVLTASTVPDTVDLIIDSDALARDGSYRLRCEIELTRLTGRIVDFDDAICPNDADTTETPFLRRAEFLRAHAGAEAFLAEQPGARWAGTQRLDPLARMLASARARALGVERAPRSSDPEVPLLLNEDPDFEGMLLSALGRAALAERELAAIRASTSWRVTAPLRWLRQALW